MRSVLETLFTSNWKIHNAMLACKNFDGHHKKSTLMSMQRLCFPSEDVPSSDIVTRVTTFGNSDSTRVTFSTEWHDSGHNQLPTLHCTCYRIVAWAIRRPWLTFVNPLANSILRRFYSTMQGLKDLLRGFGLWYYESWGIGENDKMKPDSTTQRCIL